MPTSFFGRVKALRTPVRSLLYLYFIFGFITALTATFVQISVFKMFGDISTNIIAAMLTFTGIMVGFCFFGYAISHFRLDAKQGFYYSAISFTFGLMLLSQASTVVVAFIAMFVYGLGGGFFWLTVHTYELTETRDTERDFYSSLLASGNKLISILGPLCATLIIWLSVSVLHISSFGLLFIIAPLFYILGLFCFKGIQSYRPERIELADIEHFVSEKRNRVAQLYIAGNGISHILNNLLMPLTLLYILGTELRVGAYSTIVSGLSVFLILILGQYRNKGNRILLFGLSTFGISVLLLFLGSQLTLFTLIVFTIGNAILLPILQVSDHVVSLQTMETIGRSKKDFYATMILRDFSLWVWRMVAGLMLLTISYLYTSTSHTVTIGLYFLAGSLIVSFVGAKILVDKMTPQTNPTLTQ